MPLQRAEGLTFARTLAAWCRDVLGVTIPGGRQRHEGYVTIMRHVGLHLGPEHAQLPGVCLGVIADYVTEITDAGMPNEARSHLARLVKQFGPEIAMRGIVEAVTNGAGIDAKFAEDPRAFTKYATKVCQGIVTQAAA